MPSRLLIVNCSSPYFLYVPMGSFGLCDHLDQQKIPARIFNPSLYRESEVRDRLTAVLEELQPTHVGFALHWQETAHGLLHALALVREWDRRVVTVCGGFTAGYFGESLLAAVSDLDYVVVGDPEEPLCLLLQGVDPAVIPNLVRREGGSVRSSDGHWLIGEDGLNRLSFARLDVLIDADRYLEKINTKLGFPVLLGRGCVFNCDYCGGSREAFRRHSRRHRPVTRSLAAILADLRMLHERTRLLYICYENDPSLVVDLFRAVGEDSGLRRWFTLHYGAWHLPDQQFLEAYGQAFSSEAAIPLFEFSPEVYDDAARARIKRGTTYTLAQLLANVAEIDRWFRGRVRIELFFSRYHPGDTGKSLRADIGNISRLKHRLLLKGLASVRVCYDHLSTDVGSQYWERHVDDAGSFATFLRLKEAVDAGTRHPFPVDNLCLYVPTALSGETCRRFEALVITLEAMERRCRELFHILFACMDDGWIDLLLETLAEEDRQGRLDTVFQEPPLDRLLAGLGRQLAGHPDRAAFPFLADLIRFARRKLRHAGRPVGPPRPAEGSGPLVLDPEAVAIHQHDYLDLLPFLARLRQSGGPPAYERTVFLFLPGEIIAMPHRDYRATLRFFEEPRTGGEYARHLREHAGLDPKGHLAFADRLVAGGLLCWKDFS